MKFTSYQKIIIALLALVQFSVVLDFMIMSPLGDILMKSLGMSPSQFGFAVSAYAFSAGISGFLTAGFADKYDRKKLLLFFFGGFIIGTLFCSVAQSFITLLIARIVTGIFAGVMGSIVSAIVADLFAVEQRGRVMGFIQMGFGVSQVMGIPIGIYMANHWGWQMPFLGVVGVAVILFFVLLSFMQPVAAHLEQNKDYNAVKHLWATITNPEYRVGFTAVACMSIGGFLLMPFGTAFAVNNWKITQEELPTLFMIAGIGSLVMMPIIGKLSDKIDRYKIFMIASLSMMALVLYYTRMGQTIFWLAALINLVTMALVLSRMVPAMAINSVVPTARDRGAYMSITSSLQQISGGIAASIAGMIVVQATKTSPLEHYDILGYIFCVITIITLFLLRRVVVMLRERKVENPQPINAFTLE